MRTHKDLQVWKLAIILASDVYQLTGHYPKRELFGIAAQMKRAAVSVGANIAEGAARRTRKELMHFLRIALGSASELDTLIEISRVTRMADHDKLNKVQTQLTIIAKMLNSLLRKLKVD